MRKLFTITEDEKINIKKLYFVNEDSKELDSQTQLKYNQINNVELSDCERVRYDFSKESVMNNQYETERKFISTVNNVKNSKGSILLSNLVLFSGYLCLCIQIMETSKKQKWGIKKDFFTDMYNSCSNIENYFNESYLNKLKLFLDTFRSKYNQM
jgi:hypothetical protein